MAKEFDGTLLATIVIGVLKDTFERMCHAEFGSQPVALEKDIIESDGRMRVFPMEKFNGPAYVAVVNYYLSQKDLDAGFAVGTFLLFVKEEVAEKFFRALGKPTREADDEAKVFDVIGEFCNILAGNVKNELAARGYAELLTSAPTAYKNSIPAGVPFDYDLFKKQEITVTPWNQKCVVAEACMGNIPMKGR